MFSVFSVFNELRIFGWKKYIFKSIFSVWYEDFWALSYSWSQANIGEKFNIVTNRLKYAGGCAIFKLITYNRSYNIMFRDRYMRTALESPIYKSYNF